MTLRHQSNQGNNHFFQRDTAMLERIAEVLRVVVKLVRVRKEITAGTEHITAAHIRAWQTDTFRLVNSHDILRAAIKCFAYLVADVRQ